MSATRKELSWKKKSASKEKRRLGMKLPSGPNQIIAQNSGAGSGGYIIVEMPEKERPLFHDLLRGFEDYSKLKGYHIAFSIDSSHDGRIAFKFTVKNDGFV